MRARPAQALCLLSLALPATLCAAPPEAAPEAAPDAAASLATSASTPTPDALGAAESAATTESTAHLSTGWSQAPGAPECVGDGPVALEPEGDGLALSDGHVFHDGRWSHPWPGGVTAVLWDEAGLLAVVGDEVHALKAGGTPKVVGQLQPEAAPAPGADAPARHRYHGAPLITRRGDRFAVVRSDRIHLGRTGGRLRSVSLAEGGDADAIQGYNHASVDLAGATPSVHLGWSWSVGCGGGGEGHGVFALGGRRLKPLPGASRPATPREQAAGARGEPQVACLASWELLGTSRGWFYLKCPTRLGDYGDAAVVALQPGRPARQLVYGPPQDEAPWEHAVPGPNQESTLVAYNGALWRLSGVAPAVRFGALAAQEEAVAFDGQRALVRTPTRLERRGADGTVVPVLAVCPDPRAAK